MGEVRAIYDGIVKASEIAGCRDAALDAIRKTLACFPRKDWSGARCRTCWVDQALFAFPRNWHSAREGPELIQAIELPE